MRKKKSKNGSKKVGILRVLKGEEDKHVKLKSCYSWLLLLQKKIGRVMKLNNNCLLPLTKN